MPTASGAGKLVVPYQPFKDIHTEYIACCVKTSATYKPLGLEQCRKLWSSHTLLNHIRLARPKLNFQRCAECLRLEGAIRAAARRGDAELLRKLHFERQEHLQLQMAERCMYYQRRWLSQQHGSGCLSMILDKWNSSTTIVPFVSRSPGWMRKLRNRLLLLSVLLVTLHTPGKNQNYFYIFNKSLKGDSNMNIEGIRRSTLAYSHRGADGGGPAGGHLPATFYVQADSAGDNKSQWMICFLAWLVECGYVAEVYLTFLVVGHTHEDVDQVFSLGSRFLYRSSEIFYTFGAFLEGLREAYALLDATFTVVVTLLDWKFFFGSHSKEYGAQMNERACMHHWKGLGTSRGTGENGSKVAARAFWVTLLFPYTEPLSLCSA